MANTVIQLKNSTVTGNVPSSLANGEISINSRDGKFFYSTPAGVVVTHYPYLGPAGLNQEVQFNDTGTLGSNSQLTFDKTNGKLSTQYLTVTNSSGDEGGEILLAKAVTNTTLSGTGVTIDVYQNKLRFFEQGGSARGAYIDLTTTGAGVGTNLLSSSAVSSVGGQTGAISNTQILSFVQAVSSTNNITFDYVAAANNGYGQNFKVGDDAWIGDYNNANAIKIKGQQDASNGYISFGSNTATLGVAASGPLTYTGNFLTTGTSNSSAVISQSYVQFGDGTKQYTANAGGGGGSGYSFATISNTATALVANTSNTRLTIVGESGIAVAMNTTINQITIAAQPGAQGLTVDYGYVSDPTYYGFDYGYLS